MNLQRFYILPVLFLVAAGAIHQSAFAQQANIEVDTPAVTAIKNTMQNRHTMLQPLYDSGAVGLTRDGMVAVRDANAVPLPQRAATTAAVAEENKDRAALYREIARANNHPEWEAQIKATFGERWISRANSGWYYQNAQGQWVKK